MFFGHRLAPRLQAEANAAPILSTGPESATKAMRKGHTVEDRAPGEGHADVVDLEDRLRAHNFWVDFPCTTADEMAETSASIHVWKS